MFLLLHASWIVKVLFTSIFTVITTKKMYIKEWNWRINYINLLRFEGSSISGQNQFCTSWCPRVSSSWHQRIPRDVAEEFDLWSCWVHLCNDMEVAGALRKGTHLLLETLTFQERPIHPSHRSAQTQRVSSEWAEKRSKNLSIRTTAQIWCDHHTSRRSILHTHRLGK